MKNSLKMVFAYFETSLNQFTQLLESRKVRLELKRKTEKIYRLTAPFLRSTKREWSSSFSLGSTQNLVISSRSYAGTAKKYKESDVRAEYVLESCCFAHKTIVIRGNWLWKGANINDKNNSAAVYVGSTVKVHNPLFSVGKLLRNKLMQRFYWSIQSKW